MKGFLAVVNIPILSCLLAPTDFRQQAKQQCLQTRPGDGVTSQEQLAREIRHELIALPHYSIFDNLEFRVEGTGVTLFGQVTSPGIKTNAEAAVAHCLHGLSWLSWSCVSSVALHVVETTFCCGFDSFRGHHSLFFQYLFITLKRFGYSQRAFIP